ncbi:efflux RND transporter permease subunit [Rhodovulum sulfidophilum]|uniref:efflux RND transporter permease subunit n=1 Tax=Rhodovulum sulfidophilum TaxID=35806 RepID=UPI0019225DF1|nr:efflux RND transporter permease subunit [Rhodovulum sulfidophilum]MBL3574087.1 efflux RND transporter permease subunit [Rhodovulum sulfidophilum]MCE8432164.1 efflux RND transporter permease subunit [Rhodovulum sulfidophilum]MCF4117511.1 efflux RND transporter permease subunit [Rhodovulum sulfidophilum]
MLQEALREAESGGTSLFVRRPILALVLSALIVLAGLAALFGVEIRELPNVDRPVVTVTTYFTGAAPETIDQEITSRIEGAVGRVSGIRSIESNSRFGRSRVTLEFAEDVDIDVAATDTRDAVARIQRELPDEADDPRVVKADADAQPVLRVAVTSSRRSAEALTEIVEDRIEDRLVSLPGVADVHVYGDRAPIFRIDIDQARLASRGLTLADLAETLSDAGFNAAAGDLEGGRQSLSVRTTAMVVSAEAFEDLRIAPNVFLRDVARVDLGPEPNTSVLRANGRTGIGMGVIRQAGSNTLDISREVRRTVAELDRSLPEDISIFVTSDDAVFIKGAIAEVLKTLGLAVAIVVLVIFLFLRDLRATLIPALTMPVSLIGTLAAIYLAGFSVNILTLLALVLATGMVVDDAIVVLENIVRRRAEGMGPRAAAVLGAKQVFFAVVTTTATLAAVFVPLSFLPGQAGGLFREFGFTLAIAVGISSVVALTLCPVLASRMLARAPGTGAGKGGRIGAALAGLYRRSLAGALALPLVVVTAALLFAATALLVAGGVRQELTPREDRSVALLSIQAPQGVSLDYTQAKMAAIEDAIAPLRASGEIVNIFSIAGSGGSDSRGFMVFTLAPWQARDRSQDEIVTDINTRLREVIGVRAYAIQPNSLGIRGAGSGISVALTGESYDRLAGTAQALVERMQDDGAFGEVRLDFERTQPELFVEVDRTRAADLGIDIAGLGDALRAFLNGRSVVSVFVGDQNYDVQLVSSAEPVDDPGDLENIFVKSTGGRMVPMSTFVRLEERPVAPDLDRLDQSRAVSISADLGPGQSLGGAFERIVQLSDGLLSDDNRILPKGAAATMDETNSGLLLIFGFAIAVVFLVLAAQFESFISAIVVMATVPLGLACAIFALLVTGQSLNVYSQIGLVMLVGIMAKNGILIVEFANQLRDGGATVRDAIFDAATIRLRPVMMTMVSTVLGGVPLILSSGAGAEAREALGWVIVGGLGLATLSTLYLTPVAYLLLARFSPPRAEEKQRLVRELEEALAG